MPFIGPLKFSLNSRGYLTEIPRIRILFCLVERRPLLIHTQKAHLYSKSNCWLWHLAHPFVLGSNLFSHSCLHLYQGLERSDKNARFIAFDVAVVFVLFILTETFGLIGWKFAGEMLQLLSPLLFLVSLLLPHQNCILFLMTQSHLTQHSYQF